LEITASILEPIEGSTLCQYQQRPIIHPECDVDYQFGLNRYALVDEYVTK